MVALPLSEGIILCKMCLRNKRKLTKCAWMWTINSYFLTAEWQNIEECEVCQKSLTEVKKNFIFRNNFWCQITTTRQWIFCIVLIAFYWDYFLPCLVLNPEPSMIPPDLPGEMDSWLFSQKFLDDMACIILSHCVVLFPCKGNRARK